MQAGGAMAGEIEPCKNCDDSGIDPLWEDDGQPSGMDLHGNLQYEDPDPCPKCGGNPAEWSYR